MTQKKDEKGSDYSPPSGLSGRAEAVWKDVVPRRARSVGRLSILEEALRALDRADQCRRLIEAEGLTTTTKTTGAVHVHPLAKLERESRQQFIRAMDILSLRWDNEVDGRTGVR